MAKTLCYATGGANTTTANTTECFTVSMNDFNPTEASVQRMIRSPGSCSNLMIHLTANGVAATSTFVFRKNAANGNNTVSIGSSATGFFEDTTNTDTVAAGDKINMNLIPGAGTGTFTYTSVGFAFDASTNTVSLNICSNGTNASNITTASQTTYYHPNALFASYITTETNFKERQRKAGTFKNLAAYISSNTSNNAATLRSRLNAANGALSASITGNTSGFFEDTTNTDTVAVGDDYNLSFTTGTGSTNIFPASFTTEFENTSGVGIKSASSHSPTARVTSTTYNYGIGTLTQSATETDVQLRINGSYTFSELGVFLSANTITAASTFLFRKNAANATMTISITASTTGWFFDSVHTDAVVNTDLVNCRLTTGGTGTNLTIHQDTLYAEITGGVISMTDTSSKTFANHFITKV